ncbi:hypothetical protein SRHO_G00316290 [Serrasalmus rhombeus]
MKSLGWIREDRPSREKLSGLACQGQKQQQTISSSIANQYVHIESIDHWDNLRTLAALVSAVNQPWLSDGHPLREKMGVMPGLHKKKKRMARAGKEGSGESRQKNGQTGRQAGRHVGWDVFGPGRRVYFQRPASRVLSLRGSRVATDPMAALQPPAGQA